MTNALWETLLFELQADYIATGRRNLLQTVEQPEHEEDRRVDAQGNTRVATLNLVECGPSDEGALRHHRGRQAAAAAGVSDVGT
jgi:hypothetical protein